MPNAYVRIEPGAVQVGGLARDAGRRQALSMELVALAGGSVRRTLQLREPLVVAAAFVFAVVKDISGGLRLEACAARSIDEEATLETALNRHGVELGEVRCPAALARLGETLQRCDGGRIEIGGHTDSQGSKGLNQRLSRARAEAVLDALIGRGVALDRLAARGYGEEKPVASNETEAGRTRNRRIEFTALD